MSVVHVDFRPWCHVAWWMSLAPADGMRMHEEPDAVAANTLSP